MVESTPSRQRRPPCKTNKEMSDEAADAAALPYLLTAYFAAARLVLPCFHVRKAELLTSFFEPQIDFDNKISCCSCKDTKPLDRPSLAGTK